MAEAYQRGDRVIWRWGNGRAEGRVEEVHTERVVRVIKGARIVRNGSPERPAYLIVQADGGEVLKLHTEISLG